MAITMSVAGETRHVPVAGTMAAVPVKLAPDWDSSKRSRRKILASEIEPAKCKDPASVGTVKE
jgi:hypothetical protein